MKKTYIIAGGMQLLIEECTFYKDGVSIDKEGMFFEEYEYFEEEVVIKNMTYSEMLEYTAKYKKVALEAYQAFSKGNIVEFEDHNTTKEKRKIFVDNYMKNNGFPNGHSL